MIYDIQVAVVLSGSKLSKLLLCQTQISRARMGCRQLGALPALSPFMYPMNGGAVKLQHGWVSLKLSATNMKMRALSTEEIPPNAVRRKREAQWRGGFSIGVDLGMSRTGLALSKGYSFRPLTVTRTCYYYPLPPTPTPF